VATALLSYAVGDSQVRAYKQRISEYRATIEQAAVATLAGIAQKNAELSEAIAEERSRLYAPGETSDAKFSAEIEQDLKRVGFLVLSCRPFSGAAGAKAVRSMEFEVTGRGDSIFSFLALCRASRKSHRVIALTARFAAETGLLESRIRIAYEQNEALAPR